MTELMPISVNPYYKNQVCSCAIDLTVIMVISPAKIMAGEITIVTIKTVLSVVIALVVMAF